jgi:hypothetical protein
MITVLAFLNISFVFYFGDQRRSIKWHSKSLKLCHHAENVHLTPNFAPGVQVEQQKRRGRMDKHHTPTLPQNQLPSQKWLPINVSKH